MTVLDHPLIGDRLAQMRTTDCDSKSFRALVRSAAHLMVPYVTANLETIPVQVETPLETVEAVRLKRPVILVPILRAGLSFCEGFLDLLPEATVTHLGLRRNEATLAPETYYQVPGADFGGADVLVLDPMLATGGSAVAALQQLKRLGADRIKFVCIIAAPEGVSHLEQAHPDAELFSAALDRCLDESGFIRPGLGDAGDRAFGTH